MCKTMKSLKTEEQRARFYVNAELDTHLQMFHAQVALEAVRMQHVHRELCQSCMDEVAVTA